MKDEEDKKPIALDAYEELAERYAALVDSKIENAHCELPGTLSLLPDVKGKWVLDAGCGPGRYSEWLIANGADVVAIDVSPKMVELAKQRLGQDVEVHLADLGRPLDFLKDESFDVVLCTLVLDCFEDWDGVLSEFHRVLRESGLLVFSVCHPFTEFVLRSSGSYFDTELVETTWKGFGEPHVTMPSYRRPLGAIISSITQAGFLLDWIVEPFPTEDSRRKDPETYEKLTRIPGFLCVRAIKKPMD